MKALITVGSHYVAKNKRQSILQDSLRELDGVLCADAETAENFIKKAYNMANKNYTGKAAVPKLSSWQNNDTSIGFIVEDTILLTVFLVKNDLTGL